MSDLIRIFIIYIEWEISTEEIWVCIVCWLYISVQTTVYLYNALFDDIIMYYKYTIMFKDNQTCWVKVNNLWNCSLRNDSVLDVPLSDILIDNNA